MYEYKRKKIAKFGVNNGRIRFISKSYNTLILLEYFYLFYK